MERCGHPEAGDGRHLDDAALREANAAFHGTRKALAAQLGMSERTLYRRLKRIGCVS
ncbi:MULTISPECIES: helix-turn-helix domain-containing protein [Cupriavidus]